MADETDIYNLQQWQARVVALEAQWQQLHAGLMAYQGQVAELRTLLGQIATKMGIELSTVGPEPPPTGGVTPPVAPSPEPPMHSMQEGGDTGPGAMERPAEPTTRSSGRRGSS